MALTPEPPPLQDRDAAPGGATEPGREMTFLEHLDELRRRLIVSALALVGAFLACYPFSRQIFHVLSEPVERFLPPGERLVYIRLTEPFFVYLKVAALAALFVAAPVLLLQLWLFVSPGLYRRERRYAAAFVVPASLLFLLGGWFAFSVLFPAVCRFFLGVGADFDMAVTVDEYFSLLFWTVVGVALTFELPVVLGLLGRLGLVSARTLLKRIDVAVVACLAAAAAITPSPDAMTMLIVAVPMVALYLLGVAVVWVLAPREPRPDRERTGPASD